MTYCRYLAPEYAEDGIVSVGTDVYSYGIILLISGRQVGNSKNPEQQQSLRLWVSSIVYVFRYFQNSSMSIEIKKKMIIIIT